MSLNERVAQLARVVREVDRRVRALQLGVVLGAEADDERLHVLLRLERSAVAALVRGLREAVGELLDVLLVVVLGVRVLRAVAGFRAVGDHQHVLVAAREVRVVLRGDVLPADERVGAVAGVAAARVPVAEHRVPAGERCRAVRDEWPDRLVGRGRARDVLVVEAEKVLAGGVRVGEERRLSERFVVHDRVLRVESLEDRGQIVEIRVVPIERDDVAVVEDPVVAGEAAGERRSRKGVVRRRPAEVVAGRALGERVGLARHHQGLALPPLGAVRGASRRTRRLPPAAGLLREGGRGVVADSRQLRLAVGAPAEVGVLRVVVVRAGAPPTRGTDRPSRT